MTYALQSIVRKLKHIGNGKLNFVIFSKNFSATLNVSGKLFQNFTYTALKRLSVMFGEAVTKSA